MGIPSYFSHIIKNHNIIIKKPDLEKVDNLYLDSNSIIYDVVHQYTENISHDVIFREICQKILYYIQNMQPMKNVFVALDGVAPVAKLSQQRTRRIKNTILKQVTSKINNEEKWSWDTTQITPGTQFMKSLNIYIKQFFDSQNLKCKIHLSLSNNPGEGEHKLFQFVRKHNHHKDETTVIYGLDADLIMLSLLHSKYCGDIYLYRETPHFIKQLNSDLNPDELYLLSIRDLSLKLADEVCGNTDYTDRVIEDYVFICFILGNDFIPHNPAINIRNNGIEILMEIYKKHINETNNFIIVDEKIHWKHFRQYCSIIASSENDYFIHEDNLRTKQEKRHYPTNTPEEKLYKLNFLPSLHREKEKYINPSEDGWKKRYYETLFHVEYTDERLQQITRKYLEALEWTWKYYSQHCYNWKWQYEYDYAPLIQDVLKTIPYYEYEFVKHSSEPPIHEVVQLIYVLPNESHCYLPAAIQDILQMKCASWFDKSSIHFKWEYCKYLWESHLELPSMDVDLIEKMFKIYIG